MTEILVTWAVLTLGMFFAASVVPGMEVRGGLGSHLLVSGIFGLVLALTGWFFHLVLGFLTLGLLFAFSVLSQIAVAAVVLKLTDVLVGRLRIDGCGTALLAAVILGLTDAAARYALLHMH